MQDKVHLDLADRVRLDVEVDLVVHHVLPGHEVHVPIVEVVRRVQVIERVEMAFACARGSTRLVRAVITRGIIHLEADARLHRNRLKGVADLRSLRMGIDMEVMHTRATPNPRTVGLYCSASLRAELPNS